MNLRRHWCKHSLMCLFLKQQKNKTAFVRIQALISPPKCLWFRHNWELCERIAVHVACDTLGSAFLSSVHIGELGTREVSLQLGGKMAPPHQPFILPGQPPPPPPPLILLCQSYWSSSYHSQMCSLVCFTQPTTLSTHLEHLQEPKSCFSSCPRAPGSQTTCQLHHTN